jgi:hypothetical protein
MRNIKYGFHTATSISENPEKTRTAGVTFIELMVAMSVMVLTAGYIFYAYMGVHKEFTYSIRKANHLMEAMTIKGNIDKILHSVARVKSAYINSLEYTEKNNDTLHTIVFKDTKIVKDQSATISGISKFTYSISEKQTAHAEYLLLWEALLTNGVWIGGATAVGKE